MNGRCLWNLFFSVRRGLSFAPMMAFLILFVFRSKKEGFQSHSTNYLFEADSSQCSFDSIEKSHPMFVELFEALAPFLNAGQEALPQAPDSLPLPSQGEGALPQVPSQGEGALPQVPSQGEGALPQAPNPLPSQEALRQAPAPAEVAHPAPNQEEVAALRREIHDFIKEKLRKESERGVGPLSTLFPEQRELNSRTAHFIMETDLELSPETNVDTLRECADDLREDPNLLMTLMKAYLPEKSESVCIPQEQLFIVP